MKWVFRIAGGLILVILLGAATLLVIGHRTGAGHIHASADLPGSPAAVWPWIDEGDKLKQWVSWLVEVRDWKAPAVGGKRVWVMKDENNGGMLMQIDSTCTEYAPPARLSVQLSSAGSFDGQQTYRLTDLGNGQTRLEVDSSFHFSSWFASLLEPLITPQAEKKMLGDVARLKSLLGANATAAAR
jgi:uncharacterized protein YndB with AHSA1/START domain